MIAIPDGWRRFGELLAGVRAIRVAAPDLATAESVLARLAATQDAPA